MIFLCLLLMAVTAHAHPITGDKLTKNNDTAVQETKMCAQEALTSAQFSKEVEKQQRSGESLQPFILSTTEAKNPTQQKLVNSTTAVVTALKVFRKARQGKDKETALNITQNLLPTLPEELKKTILLYNKYILAAGPVEYISEREINNGSEVLGWLEYHISLPVVKYLANNGADVLAQGGKNHRSILHRASKQGSLDVVEYLVSERHVDVNVKDGKNMTALNLAVDFSSDLGVIQYLVSHGGDVTVRDNAGVTLLHWAVRKKNMHVLKYLLTTGLDINLTDYKARTLLHWAARDGNIDVVKFIVTLYKDIDIQDSDGMTPLYYAAQYGNLEVVKYFFTFLPDVNVKNHDGKTALHLAADGGHLDVIKTIFTLNPDVNDKDNNGETPLHLAAQNGRLDVVVYLVTEQRADTSLQDNHGRTAEDLASYSVRNTNVFTWLQQNQSKVM